jgi:glycosyltransferase involved in cell wall biosynthesis
MVGAMALHSLHSRSSAPRVALVHEWLVTMRGGERVVEVFAELFPEAPIYTLVRRTGALSPALERRDIRTSFLQRLPFGVSKYRHFLPLMPAAIESFDLREFDAVLSSSFCVAKGVITQPETRHVSYCHTPMRYAWEQQQDYFGAGRASPAVRVVATVATNYLRTWDEASARRPDHYVANSRHVARRVLKRYGYEAEVIHPPVDCARFTARSMPRSDGYYAMLTAFAPYKRIDLAIEAFTRMGRRLLIAGGGQEGGRIRELVKPGGPVELVGELAGAKIAEFLAGARAFIFPGEEDFGIAPVEAQACGVPVIALGRGGALETIVGPENGAAEPTGLFFEEQTTDALIDAVERFERMEAEFSPGAARRNALRFDRPVFKETMRKALEREFRFSIPAESSGPSATEDCDRRVAVS